MSDQLPAWVNTSYVKSVLKLNGGGNEGQVREYARRLIARWELPQRKFHDLLHVKACLNRFAELSDSPARGELVSLAIWYHGAVFGCQLDNASKLHGGENKPASARLAAQELQALGVDEYGCETVADLIMSLITVLGSEGSEEARVLADIEMGSVAVDPSRFRSYRERVREEYGHVPSEQYLRARITTLQAVLEAKRLFHTRGAQEWEEQARENLTAELQKLRRELKEAGEQPPTAPDSALNAAGEASGNGTGFVVAGAGSGAYSSGAGMAYIRPDLGAAISQASSCLPDAPTDGDGPDGADAPATDPSAVEPLIRGISDDGEGETRKAAGAAQTPGRETAGDNGEVAAVHSSLEEEMELPAKREEYSDACWSVEPGEGMRPVNRDRGDSKREAAKVICPMAPAAGRSRDSGHGEESAGAQAGAGRAQTQGASHMEDEPEPLPPRK